MYLALSGTAAQHSALSAAVATVASSAVQSEFATLLTAVRSRSRERNRVVHCLWGTSEAYPDALISNSPDNVVSESTVGVAINAIIAASDPSETNLSGLVSDHFRSCLVYRKQDFADIENRLIQTREQIKAFTKTLVAERQKRLALIQALGTLLESGEAAAPLQKTQTNPRESE